MSSYLLYLLNITVNQKFHPKKYILGLGLGCELKLKPKINSEFNSIHFGIEGIEIKKRLKFLTTKNVRV